MFGRYGLQFLLQIIMARILAPSDYGAYTIAIAMVTVASSYIAGLPQALIQDEGATEKDWAVVMWFLLGVTTIVYIIFFVAADQIASFYNKLEIALYLQAIMLALYFAVYQEMQATRLIRKMQFKQLFTRSLVATIGSGLIGVCAALLGLGTWALILQYISSYIIGCVILFLRNPWFPKPRISWVTLKKYFRFSVKVFCSSLLKNNFDSIGDMILGRYLTSTQMGYIDRGRKFGQSASTIIDNPIQTVFFSLLSRINGAGENMLSTVRIVVSTYSCLVVPFFSILVLFSEQVIVFLFGSQWTEASFYFAIYCITYIPMALTTISFQAFNAMGRSGIPLVCGLSRLIIGLFAIGVAMHLNADAQTTVAFWCIWSALGTLVVMIPNALILKYKLNQQIHDFLLPCIFGGALIILPFKLENHFVSIVNPFITLGMVALGLLAFLLMCVITKQKSCSFLYGIMISKRGKNKNGDYRVG